MRKIFTVLAVALTLFAVTALPASAATYKYTHRCSTKSGHLKGRAAVYQVTSRTRQANVSQTKSWKQSVFGPDINWVYAGFDFNGVHYSGPTNKIRFAGGYIVLHRPITVNFVGHRRGLPDPHTSCTIDVY